MRASKWVVNRYFDNAMLLEKGAGNARDASQVMLVRMEPNTPSTIVQIHRDMLASGRVLLEALKGFTGEQIIKQEFSGDATWWDVCLVLAPIMGPNVWNVTLMDMEKKVSKCFWKTPLRHQVPDPEEDDGKMEPSKVEAARALVPPTKKKASKKGKVAVKSESPKKGKLAMKKVAPAAKAVSKPLLKKPAATLKKKPAASTLKKKAARR
eukprot:symbB.v1.2.027759.t1/scaffold2735.1/size73862/7